MDWKREQEQDEGEELRKQRTTSATAAIRSGTNAAKHEEISGGIEWIGAFGY